MTAKVWAFRVGNFSADKAAGWTHSIHFNAFHDLLRELGKAGLENQVETLAIVAHGDAGGVVQLERNLTAASLSLFRQDFEQLRRFIPAHGKLIFISCIAGMGTEGDQLLTDVSRILTNVHVVGFTINGAMAQEGLPSAAGQVLEGEHFMRGMPASLLRGLPPLTEYSPFSKWARNGAITKIPIQEQIKRPGYRCAWSACPGHASPKDRCVPAIKGMSTRPPYPG